MGKSAFVWENTASLFQQKASETMVDEEIKKLRQAAEAGQPEAMAVWGAALAAGEGVAQDLGEARRFLLGAAEAGNPDAMFNLGVLFQKGLGTPVDHQEAALWFWQAAEKGDSGARVRLGTMLLRGQGFPAGSPVLASVEASAEGGLPYAQAFLGKLYLDGVGVAQDDNVAERWFRRAAEHGEEGAAFNLLEMMVEGRTRETSEEELAGWFFSLGMVQVRQGNLVRAFDCLVSIKRIDPKHFLAQRLESEIEQANKSGSR